MTRTTYTDSLNWRPVSRPQPHDQAGEPSQVIPALCWGAAIGLLGGLIGLGGAEFRLPVLMGVFALAAHSAVRINLLISLATLTVAAFARFGFSSFPALDTLAIPIAAMIAGGVVSAWYGVGLLRRLSERRLTVIIGTLLLLIATLLAAEALTTENWAVDIPDEPAVRALAGFAAGVAIGLISSLLGVAGGELLIPTLLFLFAADVPTAGTASILISIPIVTIGVIRHARAGGYRDAALLTRLILPMAAGSTLGAVTGAALLPFTPTAVLKGILAVVLALSAARLLRRRH